METSSLRASIVRRTELLAQVLQAQVNELREELLAEVEAAADAPASPSVAPSAPSVSGSKERRRKRGGKGRGRERAPSRQMKKAQTYSAGEGTVESSRSQIELPPARQTVTAAESLTPETKVLGEDLPRKAKAEAQPLARAPKAAARSRGVRETHTLLRPLVISELLPYANVRDLGALGCTARALAAASAAYWPAHLRERCPSAAALLPAAAAKTALAHDVWHGRGGRVDDFAVCIDVRMDGTPIVAAAFPLWNDAGYVAADSVPIKIPRAELEAAFLNGGVQAELRILCLPPMLNMVVHQFEDLWGRALTQQRARQGSWPMHFTFEQMLFCRTLRGPDGAAYRGGMNFDGSSNVVGLPAHLQLVLCLQEAAGSRSPSEAGESGESAEPEEDPELEATLRFSVSYEEQLEAGDFLQALSRWVPQPARERRLHAIPTRRRL